MKTLTMLLAIMMSQGHPNATQEFMFIKSKTIGKTPRGRELSLGGFSGLLYLGNDKYLALTDRGPNSDLIKIIGKNIWVRTIILPGFSPELVIIKANSNNGTFEVMEEIKLTDPKGNLLSGLSPIKPKDQNSDEWLVNYEGREVAADPGGVDAEGITRDDEGNLWVCEEYLPSIIKFSSEGRMQKRYIPVGALSAKERRAAEVRFGKDVVVEVLPREMRYKRRNLGFEGIAWHNGKIYVALQSPLRESDTYFPILEFDVKSEKVLRQIRYPVTEAGVNKIGDLAASDNGIYVIEQNSLTGPEAVRKIYLIKNLTGIDLNKSLVKDLKGTFYDTVPKLEGMAILPDNRISLINDSDFEDRPTVLSTHPL